MAFVLDSSVALAWLLPDERGGAADALLDRISAAAPVAPSIWPLEMGNALLTARRRERLTDRDVERLLEVLQTLPVEIDLEPSNRSLPAVVALSRAYGLTSYDAAYLELARRRTLPLATLDARLAAACKQAGIMVLP